MKKIKEEKKLFLKKTVFKTIPLLGIFALVVFCSSTVFASSTEYITISQNGQPKNAATSFEVDGTFRSTITGTRKVTFSMSGAFLLDQPYIILQQQPSTRRYNNNQWGVLNNSSEQWLKFGGYMPSNIACGAVAYVIVRVYSFNNATQVWSEVCSTVYTLTATNPSLNGTALFCGSSTTCTVNGNGRIPVGPYSWSSSNPAFTITPTGTNETVYINCSTNAVSTTITVSGGNLCAPASFEFHHGTPRTPDNVWTDLVAPYDFHCFSGAFTESIPYASSYVWTSPYAQETLLPQNTMKLLKNKSYYLSVKAKNVCGLSAAVSSTETTLNCANKNGEDVTAITTNDKDTEFSVFPNPANASFQINIPSNGNKARVRIMNITGQIIQDINTSESRLIVQTADMPAGLYLINISSDELNIDRKIQVIK